MKCNIRGEKIKITKAIDNYIDTKMARLDKYFKENDVKANIIVKLKDKKQAIEVTIPYDKYILRNEEVHDDLYAAIDLVTDKLERQIRKNKTRLTSKKVNNNKEFALQEIKEEKSESKIVRRKSVEVKPMNEEEAILQMELLGHEFYMYKDADTNKAAVVYKRKDGNYGIISSE